jgi:RNA polymerase sigma factor (sigma-70 family)
MRTVEGMVIRPPNEQYSGSFSPMHGPMRHNSPYSDFVAAAYEAHLKELLRLAGSGQHVKKTETDLPPLEEYEAENCVTDSFIRLLKAIERRNPKVMEIVLDYEPSSNVVRFLMILMLQRSIIDYLRKRTRGTYLSEADMAWVERMDSEMDDGRIGAIEWLVHNIEPDWHVSPPRPDMASARTDLMRLFDHAVAAGKLNEKYQRVFQGMMHGYLLGLDDEAIAKSLGLGTQDFQRLRYKLIQKLRPFAGS